jgi:protein gp37
MAKTKIEWADRVWNPVTGCTKVSEGCRNCYAERMARRLAGRCGYPGQPNQFNVTLHPGRLDEPLKWKKPCRIFVDSMGDLFHEDVPVAFIWRVWYIMHQTPQHTYMILTKRAERMNRVLSIWLKDTFSADISWPFPNVWLGVSVEDQKTANERIPWLLKTPAAVRFVSCEPLLGPVNLENAVQVAHNDLVWYEINAQEDVEGDSEPEELIEDCEAECDWVNYGDRLVINPEYVYWHTTRHEVAQYKIFKRDIHWVICGGETGPGARMTDPIWVTNLLKQCKSAGVPFFFKRWGDAPIYKAIKARDGILGKQYHEFPREMST